MSEKHPHKIVSRTIFLSMVFMTVLTLGSMYFYLYQTAAQRELDLTQSLSQTEKLLKKKQDEVERLKKEDQRARNDKLQEEIKNIERTYGQAVRSYEELLKLKEQTNKTAPQDKLFVDALTFLSKRNFASAEATLSTLNAQISAERAKIAASFVILANVPAKNEAPSAGNTSRQSVATDFGTFLVDVIAADLGSTRVIVDTASDSTCRDNCPVASLGTYAGRSGAFAGINGPYFCPAAYPSCAGKTNSFDTLLMNKNKVYFNSDNNVYSNVPAVIFSGGSARYVGASSQWGRDTGVDSVIAAQPMLLSGGNVVFGGDDEAKRAGAGSRSFIGSRGSTVYIGVVHNANVAQVARVLKVMGLEYALNLDSGGSTALWSGGRYIVGPGRDTPFGILFVRR